MVKPPHLPVFCPILQPRVAFALFHTSPRQLDPNKKAVLEKAVDGLKEKKSKAALTGPEDVRDPLLCLAWHMLLSVQLPLVSPKPSLATRVKEVALHYFHGFRLLVLDVRVAVRLLLKTLQGHTLTRRESKQFRRTVADMFRIVPFSVFIIIPFMEFLLPVYVYFFPSALPSTFQSSSSKVSETVSLTGEPHPLPTGRSEEEGAKGEAADGKVPAGHSGRDGSDWPQEQERGCAGVCSVL